MTSSMRRVILFDVDGVLIHGYHARLEYRRCWDENLARDFGIDRARFTEEFIRGPFVQKVLTGALALQDALAEILPQFGYHGPPQPLIDYWLRHDAAVNHDLLALVKRIKAAETATLFIATNQEHNRAGYLMHELGFATCFKDIFYSARVGVLKPDRRYFDWIAHKLALPDHCQPLLIDDTPEVVAAARAYGWQALEFTTAAELERQPLFRAVLPPTAPTRS